MLYVACLSVVPTNVIAKCIDLRLPLFCDYTSLCNYYCGTCHSELFETMFLCHGHSYLAQNKLALIHLAWSYVLYQQHRAGLEYRYMWTYLGPQDPRMNLSSLIPSSLPQAIHLIPLSSEVGMTQQEIETTENGRPPELGGGARQYFHS